MTVRITRAWWVQLALVFGYAAWWRWGSPPGVILLQGLVFAAVLALTVAIHEGAHVVLARRLGLAVHGVVIRGVLDGATAREAADTRRDELAVILAGPAANVALALIGAAIAVFRPDPFHVGGWLLAVNALAALASLVSGSRSDGWRAWRVWRGAGTKANHDQAAGRLPFRVWRNAST